MQRVEVVSRFFLALTSSAFLFIGGVSLPPLGVIFLPFVAQPILVFGFKYGVGAGLGVVGLAILLLVIFAGEELALVYGIFGVLVGLLFGLLGRLRAIEQLVLAVAGVLSGLTAAIGLYFYGSWSGLFQDLRAGLTQQIASAVQVQEKMGLSQESLEVIKNQGPQIVEAILQLLPALIFLSFAFIALINVLYLGRRFPERRSQWFSLRYLREWMGPEPLVWALIACGFALFIPGLAAVRVVALNLLVIIGACYFAQGLAVIAFFFHKNNVPRFLRGLTYVLILFQQIFTLLVVGLGLFDLWGDFRRLKKNNLTPSQAS